MRVQPTRACIARLASAARIAGAMRVASAVLVASAMLLGCGSAPPRVSSTAAGEDAEVAALDPRDRDDGDDERPEDEDSREDHDARSGGRRAGRLDDRDGAPGTDQRLDRVDRLDRLDSVARLDRLDRLDPRDAATGAGNAGARIDDRSGPDVAEVLAAAYAAAGLAHRLPGHIAARARLGGLVPWVSVRTGRDTSWRDEDPDVGRGTTLEVRATWRLDRVVFDGRELQVVALEAARRRERRRLATQVIGSYFAWKRARSRSHSAEAAAELDALTSGWFSEALQRAASEDRTKGPTAATP